MDGSGERMINDYVNCTLTNLSNDEWALNSCLAWSRELENVCNGSEVMRQDKNSSNAGNTHTQTGIPYK